MDEPNMRVGDADRERVAELLQRAVGEGMLDLDEFSDRMGLAMAARTRGELRAVLTDLPGMSIELHSALRPAPAPAAVEPVTATLSSIHRDGNWRVPEQLLLKTRLSSVLLDLTRASIATALIVVDVDDLFSSTEIVLPEDFTADLTGLRCVGSSAHSRVRTAPPAGRVHLVVRGRVWFGSVTVKHPSGGLWRRLLS